MGLHDVVDDLLQQRGDRTSPYLSPLGIWTP